MPRGYSLVAEVDNVNVHAELTANAWHTAKNRCNALNAELSRSGFHIRNICEEQMLFPDGTFDSGIYIDIDPVTAYNGYVVPWQ